MKILQSSLPQDLFYLRGLGSGSAGDDINRYVEDLGDLEDRIDMSSDGGRHMVCWSCLAPAVHELTNSRAPQLKRVRMFVSPKVKIGPQQALQ